ncbi:MAG: helix-turn-helix domain-containing protein [Actinomycetota bacterium]|nr:helix-turn-helix domain-containing protein [Actinomycetota bacterium]
MVDKPDPLGDLGQFIREQRSGARLSLRRLSDMAGISNPYLSQIERGLRRPSAEILQQIAKALRISAETLYVRAGILDERAFDGNLGDAIMADTTLTEEHKQALLQIYLSFRREYDADLPVPIPAVDTAEVLEAVDPAAVHPPVEAAESTARRSSL